MTAIVHDWHVRGDVELSEVNLDGRSAVSPWFTERSARLYFDELLGACFERTLVIDTLRDTAATWIFTGPHGGVTIDFDRNVVGVQHRFYDSPAFVEIPPANGSPRHPQWSGERHAFKLDKALTSVTLLCDHALRLVLMLNGEVVHREVWAADLTRHQLRLANDTGELRGRMERPAPKSVTVRVDPGDRFQAILGFGGTTAPSAFAMLSTAGQKRWWRLITDYNLLIQREYPMGQELRQPMDNLDSLDDAVPHYYGDNFPNSEVTDFRYLRELRDRGGQVWFEYWALPKWVGDDPAAYAQAVVRYCQISVERAGAPPDIVGIQNELPHPAEQWHRMTVALREALDEAGFGPVEIHMSDAPFLTEGIERAADFKADRTTWGLIDFGATHFYDYQEYLTDPDAFDAIIARWNAVAGDKPFLATELCINDLRFQHDSYRLALVVAELYHKNLTQLNACAIAYCWLLLNVTQPSYGATRSLCVPDEAHGFVPVASSHQLRTFGAYSRRIRRGMHRVQARSDDEDVLVTAFQAEDGRATLVLLNRSGRVMRPTIIWSDVAFTEWELVDPFHQNDAFPISGELSVPPGGIVTLSNTERLGVSGEV